VSIIVLTLYDRDSGTVALESVNAFDSQKMSVEQHPQHSAFVPLLIPHWDTRRDSGTVALESVNAFDSQKLSVEQHPQHSAFVPLLIPHWDTRRDSGPVASEIVIGLV